MEFEEELWNLRESNRGRDKTPSGCRSPTTTTTPQMPGTLAEANAISAEDFLSLNCRLVNGLEQKMVQRENIAVRQASEKQRQEAERLEAERQKTERYRLEEERKKRDTVALEAVLRKEREARAAAEQRLVMEESAHRMAQKKTIRQNQEATGLEAECRRRS